MNLCELPQILGIFAKIKYMLNLFLWNTLKLSDAKIKQSKLFQKKNAKWADDKSFLSKHR